MNDGAQAGPALLRSLATYVLFVGVPVAGLFGVVHAGRSIEPPPFVGGVWHVADPEVRRCYGVSELEIDQSGIFLQIEVERRTASARVEHGRVIAELASTGGACRDRAVALDATAGDDALTGTIVAEGCDVCPPLRFRAERPALHAEE